jgi:hypothetical protein
LSIRNAGVRLRIVMLESWGREFPLRADDKLEVTASNGEAGTGLRLVETDDRTVVFVEGCSGVRVTTDGVIHDLDSGVINETIAPQAMPPLRPRDPMWDRDLDS